MAVKLPRSLLVQHGFSTHRTARCAVSLILSVFALQSASAQSSDELAVGQGSSAARIWQSENRTYEQLARDIAGLYLSLYNGSALPIKRVPNPSGRTVSELMYDEGVFLGSYFPVELDALTCDLNPSYCEREIAPAEPEIWVSLEKHVAFSTPTSGKWTNAANDALILPYQRLERVPAWTAHFKHADQSLSEIVTRVTNGCESFDSACQEKIRDKNRLVSDALAPDFAGELYLPTLAVKTDLTGDVSSLRVEFTDLADLPLMQPALLTSREDFGFGAPSLAERPAEMVSEREITPEEKNRILDRALVRDVAKQVDSVIKGLFRFALPDAASVSLVDRFRAQRLPFSRVDEYPSDLSRRINVAVLDEKFDTSGCGFGGRLEILTSQNAVVVPQEGGPCNLTYDPNAKFGPGDHGTHIAGLIAASVDGDMVGINPYAYVLGVELSVGDLDSGISQRDLLRRLEAADDKFSPFIFNLSWGYFRDPQQRPAADRIREFMKENQNAILFVVAAGNDGADLNGSCDLRPACFGDLSNVITVVAAARAGVDIVRAEFSNYSSVNFHLAAIGENVMSLAPGGRVGTMSGTSQAAPQVAAAASLMMAKQTMRPFEIKQRLVACSNLDHGQIGGVGGLLDVECALHLEHDVFELLGGEKFDGLLHDVPNDTFRLDAPAGGPPRTFSKESVLALVQDPGSDSYTVFFTTDGKDVHANSNLLLRSENDVFIKYRRYDQNAGASGIAGEVRISGIKRWVRSPVL